MSQPSLHSLGTQYKHCSVSLESSSFTEEEGVAALNRQASNISCSFEHLESQLADFGQGRQPITPGVSLIISQPPAERCAFAGRLMQSSAEPRFLHLPAHIQMGSQACRHASNSQDLVFRSIVRPQLLVARIARPLREQAVGTARAPKLVKGTAKVRATRGANGFLGRLQF